MEWMEARKKGRRKEALYNIGQTVFLNKLACAFRY